MTRSDLLGLAIILVAAVSWLSRWEGSVFVDPAPEPGPRVVLLFEETQGRSPELANILVSPTWRKYLADNGHTFHAWDVDLRASAGEKWQPWFERAGDDLPVWFVALDDGRVLYDGRPPGTVQAAIELLQEHGG